jgi:hypothetical protein
MDTVRLSSKPVVAVLVYVGLLGCTKEVQIHTYDKDAIAALEPYAPKYEMNADGRVIKLRLEGPQVTDAVFEHVKQLTELNTLSLYGSAITDNGLTHLSGLGRLHSLGIGKTAISNRGLTSLKQIRNLRWIWITKSAKTASGVEELKKTHKKLTVYQ